MQNAPTNFNSITIEEFMTFLKCPMLLYYNDINEICINKFYESIHNTFRYYFLQYVNGRDTTNARLRTFFSQSFDAQKVDPSTYMTKSGFLKSNSFIYKAAELIDNFKSQFNETTMAKEIGKPVVIDKDFRVECNCGKHYLEGRFDLITELNAYNNIIQFNLKSDFRMIDVTLGYLPALYLYAYEKMHNNKKEPVFYYYNTKASTLKSVYKKKVDLYTISKLICTISDVKNKTIAWKINNPEVCLKCKYHTVCKEN